MARACIVAALVACTVCATGCSSGPDELTVACWDFDVAPEPGLDRGGWRYDAEVHGGAAVALYVDRGVIRLDGVDDYLEVPFDSPFDLDAFRIEVVFRVDEEGRGKRNAIIGKGDGTASNWYDNYLLCVTADGGAAFEYEPLPRPAGGEPAVLRTQPGVVSSGVWYRLRAGIDGEGRFLDLRDLDADRPVAEVRAPKTLAAALNDLQPLIGAWRGASGTRDYFHGEIDEIAVFAIYPRKDG